MTPRYAIIANFDYWQVRHFAIHDENSRVTLSPKFPSKQEAEAYIKTRLCTYVVKRGPFDTEAEALNHEGVVHAVEPIWRHQ